MKNKELFEEAVYLYDNKRYEDAVYLFEGLVEERYAEALNYLGGCYLEGKGVLPDTRKAFEYLITAAVLGLDTAQYNLAQFYEKRRKDVDNILSPLLAISPPSYNQTDDLAEAEMYWYYQAANQKYPPALHRLGNYAAASPNANYDEALHYYRLAAAEGYAPSQYALGFCYEHGNSFSMLTDYEMAAKWYLKAAKNKHTQAMIDLSRLYANGLGVEVNEKKAAFWKNQAAYFANSKTPCKLYDMEGKYNREIKIEPKPVNYPIIIYPCSCHPNIQCGLATDDKIYKDEFGSKSCVSKQNITCFGKKVNCKPIKDVRIEAELNPLHEWEYKLD